MLIDFKTLFPKYGINPKGVLHIGANVGEEAPTYLKLGVSKQVWIEGNPEIFLKLKSNLSNNPQATAFNYVVGDENKDVVFHVSNNGSQSSSVLELGTHKIAHPTVHYVDHINTKMHRIDSLDLDLDGIDFLNIDLQGAELMALRGMGDLLKQFKWAYLEVNWKELYKGCALFDELERFMVYNGFIVATYKECGSTGWGDCLFIRKFT